MDPEEAMRVRVRQECVELAIRRVGTRAPLSEVLTEAAILVDFVLEGKADA